MLVYFTAIWYSLRQFGVFYSNLVYVSVLSCISSRFGMLLQERSGNPGAHANAKNRNRNGIKITAAQKTINLKMVFLPFVIKI
jgi:hypothetical protein